MHDHSCNVNSDVSLFLGISPYDALDVLMFWVFINYTIIGFQVLIATKPSVKSIKNLISNKEKKNIISLLCLVAIFELCGITGYLARLLGINPWIVVVLHLLIVVFSQFFIHLRRSQALVKALTND